MKLREVNVEIISTQHLSGTVETIPCSPYLKISACTLNSLEDIDAFIEILREAQKQLHSEMV